MVERHPRWRALVDGTRALVGTRFRHHGRDAAGLDCVGVALLAGRAAGLAMPEPPPYAARATLAEEVAAWLVRDAFSPVTTAVPGDLLWVAAGASHHLLVAVPGGVVEASAPLRRVVERPGPFEQPHSAWRFPER